MYLFSYSNSKSTPGWVEVVGVVVVVVGVVVVGGWVEVMIVSASTNLTHFAPFQIRPILSSVLLMPTKGFLEVVEEMVGLGALF